MGKYIRASTVILMDNPCPNCDPDFDDSDGMVYWQLCKSCLDATFERHVETRIEVDADTFAKYQDKVSAGGIAEGKVKAVFHLGDKLYAMTGASYGPDPEKQRVYGRECVPLEFHDGPTHTGGGLQRHNGSGGPHYINNAKFSCRGKEYVIVPDVSTIFIPKGTPSKQLNMF